jgi:uncharacterized protein (TIGR02246 family)
MSMHRLWLTAIAAMVVSAWPALAKPPQGDSKDSDAIQKNAQAFIEAFQKGDAKTVAGFWTPDGDYTEQSGKNMKGRDAIEKAFEAFFAENKDLKLRIDSDSLKFVTPEVAIEDGTTEVIPPDGSPPSRARYTIVHVKKNGQWQLSSVRDAPYAPATNADNLHALEWAIGEWVDDNDKGEVARVSFEWSPNQGFIISNYATTFKNIALTSGTQWIGWDPEAKRIRSWTFDANGGFGEGSWSMEGDKCIIKTTSLLPDGKKVAATNIVTKLDADTLTWQSKDRTLDGKALPDIKEIKMKRAK